jgi:RNA-binding protein
MQISIKQRQQLRAQAHHLKPIILIGQLGLTDAVHQEIDRALMDHELIKVRFNAEKLERDQMIQTIVQKNQAIHIQTIGRIGIFYRPNEDSKN